MSHLARPADRITHRHEAVLEGVQLRPAGNTISGSTTRHRGAVKGALLHQAGPGGSIMRPHGAARDAIALRAGQEGRLAVPSALSSGAAPGEVL